MIRYAVPLPVDKSAAIVTAKVNAERVCPADQVPVPRRRHSRKVRMWIWQKDRGICHLCNEPVAFEDCQISHNIPLAAGGKDIDSNRHPAHVACHAERTAKRDAPLLAKARRADRVQKEGRGTKRKGRPIASRPMRSAIARRFAKVAP